ncbi:MAG: hypothetical protein EBU31_14460 [Proteobacteria bacterium]|nr:hypothetical protein [Pseudomonadota bacterium]
MLVCLLTVMHLSIQDYLLHQMFQWELVYLYSMMFLSIIVYMLPVMFLSTETSKYLVSLSLIVMFL